MKWISVCLVLTFLIGVGCSTTQKSQQMEIVSMSDDEVRQLVLRTVPMGTTSSDADSVMTEMGFQCRLTRDSAAQDAQPGGGDELRCRRKDTNGLVDIITVVSLKLSDEKVANVDVNRLFIGP